MRSCIKRDLTETVVYWMLWQQKLLDEILTFYSTQHSVLYGLAVGLEDPSARNVTFDELVNAYLEQAVALMDGAVVLREKRITWKL